MLLDLCLDLFHDIGTTHVDALTLLWGSFAQGIIEKLYLGKTVGAREALLVFAEIAGGQRLPFSHEK